MFVDNCIVSHAASHSSAELLLSFFCMYFRYPQTTSDVVWVPDKFLTRPTTPTMTPYPKDTTRRGRRDEAPPVPPPRVLRGERFILFYFIPILSRVSRGAGYFDLFLFTVFAPLPCISHGLGFIIYMKVAIHISNKLKRRHHW